MSPFLLVLFEIFCFIYVMIGLAYLSNNFLMPCLEIICRKFDFREHTAGLLLALGCSVFEMTTNILACFNEDKEMAQFGLGIIVGSGVFDFTLCLGIASVFSKFYHKDIKYFHIQTMLRDIYFYLLSLVYIVFICWDFKVTLVESAFLVSLYPGYLVFTFYIYSTKNEEKSMESDNSNVNVSTIKKSLPWSRIYQNFRKNPYTIYNNEYKFDFDEIETSKTKNPENTYDEEQESLLLEADSANNRPAKSLCFEGLKCWFNFLKSPWKLLFANTIFYENYSFIAFFLILFYTTILSRYLIYSVELVVNTLPLSHVFVGLTFASWGGNISDVANATISAKNCKIELATSTVIGSQIVNLQLCLGIPWLLCNALYGPIFFSDISVFNSIFVIFIIVLLTLSFMYLAKYRLSLWLGVQLIVLYGLYIMFEFYQTFSK